MSELFRYRLQAVLQVLDPCFSVSARCIFVNKNYLATHYLWSFVVGSAAELASPRHFNLR
jgi:hypothetical protein